MVVIMIGGVLSAMTIRQELMPAQETRMVELSVDLPRCLPGGDEYFHPDGHRECRARNGRNQTGGFQGTRGCGNHNTYVWNMLTCKRCWGDIKNAVDRIEDPA